MRPEPTARHGADPTDRKKQKPLCGLLFRSHLCAGARQTILMSDLPGGHRGALQYTATSSLCSRQESNLDLELRRPVFYPLNYRSTQKTYRLAAI